MPLRDPLDDELDKILSQPNKLDMELDSVLAGTYKPPEPPGFLKSIGTSALGSAGSGIAGVGTALEDVGLQRLGTPVREYGEGIQQANPSSISQFSDILDKPKQFAGEALGQVGSSVLATAGGQAIGRGLGTVIGAALPIPGAAGALGALGGLAGGFASNLAGEYGETRANQREMGFNDPTMALAAAVPAAALDYAADRYVGKIGKLGQLDTIPQGMTRPGFMAQEALKGALIEGPVTEVPQTVLERLGGGKDIASNEALNEYGIAGAMGALGGGVVSGGIGGLAPYAPPQQDQTQPAITPDQPAEPQQPMGLGSQWETPTFTLRPNEPVMQPEEAATVQNPLTVEPATEQPPAVEPQGLGSQWQKPTFTLNPNQPVLGDVLAGVPDESTQAPVAPGTDRVGSAGPEAAAVDPVAAGGPDAGNEPRDGLLSSTRQFNTAPGLATDPAPAAPVGGDVAGSLGATEGQPNRNVLDAGQGAVDEAQNTGLVDQAKVEERKPWRDFLAQEQDPAMQGSILRTVAKRTQDPQDLTDVLDSINPQTMADSGNVAYDVLQSPYATDETKAKAQALVDAIPALKELDEPAEAKSADDWLNVYQNTRTVYDAEGIPRRVAAEQPPARGREEVTGTTSGLTFRDEVRGAQDGQIDSTLYAMKDGKPIGRIDYSIYNGKPAVQMIEVDEDQRRKGYGTELMLELQRQFPDTEIDMGEATPEGVKLIESLPKTQTESEYAAKFDELQQAKAQRDNILQTKQGVEQLNDLHDRIYDLEQELFDKSPTKTLLGASAQEPTDAAPTPRDLGSDAAGLSGGSRPTGAGELGVAGGTEPTGRGDGLSGTGGLGTEPTAATGGDSLDSVNRPALAPQFTETDKDNRFKLTNVTDLGGTDAVRARLKEAGVKVPGNALNDNTLQFHSNQRDNILKALEPTNDEQNQLPGQPEQPARQEEGTQAQAQEEVGQYRRGEVGGKYASGEIVTTSSGRQTTPFPKVKLDTKRKVSNTLKNVDQWLLQNALQEARARGDEFNASGFEQDLKSTIIPPATKDAAEEYLFGEQPEVRPSMLKPLTRPDAPNQPAPTAPQAEQQPGADTAASPLEQRITDGFTQALQPLIERGRDRWDSDPTLPEKAFDNWWKENGKGIAGKEDIRSIMSASSAVRGRANDIAKELLNPAAETPVTQAATREEQDAQLAQKRIEELAKRQGQQDRRSTSGMIRAINQAQKDVEIYGKAPEAYFQSDISAQDAFERSEAAKLRAKNAAEGLKAKGFPIPKKLQPFVDQVASELRSDIAQSNSASNVTGNVSSTLEPWQQSFDDFANQQVEQSKYAETYRNQPKLAEGFKSQQSDKWIDALKQRATEGRVDDKALDDFVGRYGVQALQNTFRGQYEKGIEGYMPPDVRSQTVTDRPVAPQDKPAHEMTWAEYRQYHTPDGFPDNAAKTPAYWKALKQQHRSQLSKKNSDQVPEAVRADYPDLFQANAPTTPITGGDVTGGVPTLNLAQRGQFNGANSVRKAMGKPALTEAEWLAEQQQTIPSASSERSEPKQNLGQKLKANAEKAKPAPTVYDDPRMKRPIYRNAIQSYGKELTPGGDIQYVRDENDRIVRRTASINPQWFQNLPTDTKMSVKDAQKAIQKASAGEKLGVREQRLIRVILDEIQGERTAPKELDFARNKLEAQRQRQRQEREAAQAIRATLGLDDDESVTLGYEHLEDDYDADNSHETRIIGDLAQQYRAMPDADENWLDALLEKDISDAEIVKQLQEQINGRTRQGSTETDTQVAGEAADQAGSELFGGLAESERPTAERLALEERQKELARRRDASQAPRGGGLFDIDNRQDDIFSEPAETLPAAEAEPTEPKTKKRKVSQKARAEQAEPIKDFGEKLEGARKDYASKMQAAKDVDIASEPLSKSWPEPDYQKMLDGGIDPWSVAFVRSMRDGVPTKPQKSWKLNTWVKQVKELRDFAMDIEKAGETEIAKLKMMLGVNRAFQDIAGRIELYQAVGHEKSLKGVTLSKHHYTLYKGQSNVTKWAIEQQTKATAFSNWPREIAVADSKEEVIAQFKAKYAGLELGGNARGKPSFIIYRKRGEEGAIIGKKIGREYVDLHKANSVTEAREYMANNLDALEAKLKKYKETPYERNEENAPRVGEDHRNGAPVTPQVFGETFGFRGVQFGNYVEQDRRQSDLNEAYDGLMDMAAVLGIPAKAISLNGRLGLAFGARGKGGINAAAAHYEPDTVVINLTKGGGPGSLAHEFWHALDNYFAKEGGGKGFMTADAKGDALRAEMRDAFMRIKQGIRATAMRERARQLDKRRTKAYWNTDEELSARAFESYIIAKLQDQNAANDYLANVVSQKAWDTLEDMRDFGATDKKPSYPYPTVAELPAIRAAFDDFFKTVQTKDTDQGVAMFSREQNPIFYSQLARAFDSAKSNTMPGHQWASWIKGNAAKLGVKADEIAWTGIDDYLTLRAKEKVTKAEIADYLSQNGVQVQDVMKGETNLDEVEMWWNDEGGANEETPFDELSPQEQREAAERYADEVGRYAEDGTGTKFSTYTIPGGTNYRELLITLPDKGLSDAQKEEFKRAVAEGRTDDAERIRQSWPTSYKSSHWNETNVLAHLRFDERTDADGQKVMFITEIQSDWGQQYKKTKESLAAHQGHENIRDIEEALRRTAPNAPFVTDTKSWVSLALKRAIRYASENGFDKIAFANGQQNADLYDLSKQVEYINYRKVGDDKYQLEIVSTNGTEVTLPKDAYAAEELEDVVGKEIAQKIVNDEGERNGQRRTLRDMDLKVGGEGMRAFYDTIVPSVANDVLKKLGGGRVGMIRVDTATDEMRPGIERARSLGKLVYGYGTSEQPGFTLTPELREKALGGLPLFARPGRPVQQEVGAILSRDAVQARIDAIRTKLRINPNVTIQAVDSEAELPADIQAQARKEGAVGQVIAVHQGNSIYLVAGKHDSAAKVEESILHESNHYGANVLFGRAKHVIYNRLFNQLGGEKGIREYAGKLGLKMEPYFTTARGARGNLSDMRLNSYLVDEFLANAQGTKAYATLPQKIKTAIQEFYGAIRNWLRQQGFAELAKFTDADLAYLLRSIHKAAQGNAASVRGKPMFMVAFHGTPYDFDKFSTSKIGTGEGSQAFGYGLYFTNAKDIAEHYRQKLATGFTDSNGNTLHYGDVFNDAYQAVMDSGAGVNPTYARAIAGHVNEWVEAGKKAKTYLRNHYVEDNLKPAYQAAIGVYDGLSPSKGRLYQVELAPAADEYLDWHKPLSEQSEKVKAALAQSDDRLKFGKDKETIKQWMDVTGNLPPHILKSTGNSLYTEIASQLGSDKAASAYLHSLGIRGIRYPAEGQTGGKSGDRMNFVVFSDEDVSITAKFSREAIGRGSTGDVYRDGDEVIKQATGHEAKIYKALSGVEGIAPGYEQDGEIRTPYYRQVISIDTIPRDERAGFAGLIEQNAARINKAMSALSETGFYYNDPLQFGVREDGKMDLLDFSAASNNFPKEVRSDNAGALATFYRLFGLPELADAVSKVNNVLSIHQLGAKDEGFRTMLWGDREEGIRHNKMLRELGGERAEYAYLRMKGEPSDIPETARFKTKAGVTGILSKEPLSDAMMAKNGLLPVVHPASKEPPMFSRSPTIDVDGVQRPTTNSEGRPIHSTEEGLRNFWRWFSGSAVTDDQGRPLVVYHGTKGDIDSFDPLRVGENFGVDEKGFFFTGSTVRASGYADPNSEFAAAGMGVQPGTEPLSGANVMPVYLSIKSPLSIDKYTDAFYTNPSVEIDDQGISLTDYFDDNRNSIMEFADNDKHDGVLFQHKGKTLAVAFSPNQIKSSIGNTGAFSPDNNDIRFSRQYTPEQQAVIDKFSAGQTMQQKPWRERVRQATDNWQTAWAQKVVDRYRSFRDILRNPELWMQARLAGQSEGAVHAGIHFGAPEWDAMGQAIQANLNTKPLEQINQDLGGEINDFFKWVAAQRADRINRKADTAAQMAEILGNDIAKLESQIEALSQAKGNQAERIAELQQQMSETRREMNAARKAARIRERFLDDETIEAGLTFDEGTMADGRDRATVYAQAMKDFNKLNDAYVNLNVEAGAISEEDAERWRSEGVYVPFYRFLQDDEGNTSSRGLRDLASLDKQTAFKQFKGSAIPLNDLLSNVLANWHHLAHTATHNATAVKALEQASDMGLAERIPESQADDKSLWVREDGKKVFYRLANDSKDAKLVWESIQGMNYQGWKNGAMDAAQAMAGLLRAGVTANPVYRYRNLIRDTMQALATSNVPLNAVVKGWQQTGPKTIEEIQRYANMLASGGLFGIHEAGYLREGNPGAANAKAMLKLGAKPDTDNAILLTQVTLSRIWDKYQDTGARLENVNRAAAFTKTYDETGSLLKAAFEANDLMPFQMRGTSQILFNLSRVVPFFNSRLQGLDKLARSATDPETRQRFWAVTGSYVALSLMAYLALKDDDDYEELEQWKRDAYHYFKVDGQLYKLPRPFEMGVLAMLAERTAEQVFKDVPASLWVDRVMSALGDTFAMNPIPQALKPMMDVYANRDSFTGRPIESLGMENRSKTQRKTPDSSYVGVGVSEALDALFKTMTLGKQETPLSPVQVDELVKGYLGWVGSFALAGSNMILDGLTGAPDKPEDIRRIPIVGDMLNAISESDTPRSTAYSSAFYDHLKIVRQAQADFNQARKLGDTKQMQDIRTDKPAAFAAKDAYNKAASNLTDINNMMQKIQASNDPGDVKKRKLDELTRRKNRITHTIESRFGKTLETF